MSKQEALDANTKAIQQIIFISKANENAMVYYIFENSKEAILQFS